MATELFFILLFAGLVLVGAEIFVPGGILGVMGGFALLGAIVCGFLAFPGLGGWIAVGIIFLVGVAMVLWIKIFPRTRIGKTMTVSDHLGDSKGTEPGIDELMGKDGTTLSELRPAGYADIDGHRVDVITRGGMLAKGERVRVIEVESNRVVVKRIDEGKE